MYTLGIRCTFVLTCSLYQQFIAAFSPREDVKKLDFMGDMGGGGRILGDIDLFYALPEEA